MTPSTPTDQTPDLDLDSIAAEAAAANAAAASGAPTPKKRPSRRHSPVKAYSIKTAMEKALADANSAIVGGLEKTVKMKLEEVAAKLKMTVKI